MTENWEQAEPLRLKQLYRLVQCLNGSIVLLSSWDQLSYHHSALIFLAALLVYQLLTFSIYVYYATSPWLKTSGVIVGFVDGVIAGLLLKLIEFDYALSLGIVISFSIVYLRPPKTLALTAICGIFTTILSARSFSLPSVLVTGVIQSVALTLSMSFFLIYSILKHREYAALAGKLEDQSVVNGDLELRIFRISKYLSPVLRKAIVAGKDVCVTAQEKPLTIFFSDMQGFSRLSEELSSEQLTWVVNSYLTEMSEIVFSFGGTLDKVIGDSLMVFFGDPNSRGAKEDATACVCMAIAMNEAMEALKQRWVAKGISSPPSLRMGINSGTCKVGNFGTENRLEYTVLGSAVNLASHLEAAAEANEIILSEHTYNLVKDRVYCIKKPAVQIKGFLDSVIIYKAVDIYKNGDLSQDISPQSVSSIRYPDDHNPLSRGKNK